MITNRIYEWARSDPTKPAVIFGERIISYSSFFGTIEVLRKFFAQQHLPAGHTAIVLTTNMLEAWISITALRALGLNTISVQSVKHIPILKIKEAICVVVKQSERDRHDLNSAELTGTKVITVPTAIFSGGQTADLSSHEESNRQFGGHIIYSSGTTGTYKKLMVDGALEDQRNEARARAYSFGRQTIYHTLNFGMWTTVGFKNPSAVWHEGGCVVFDPRRDKFNHFFRHPITSTVLTPEDLKDFIQVADISRLSNHEFELVITAGFLPLALAEAAVRQLTKRVTIFYGSSELGSPLMRSNFQTTEDLHWFTPVGARTIQIVDENGNECAIDQEGDLRILTADIDCKSYLDDDEANSRIFRDGFFYPGDMAIRRADGRIRILGRTADVLNLRGKKIAAAPLEHAIQRALGVGEVCLFSRLDDDGNEELMIAIQSDHELPRSQLEAIVPKLPKFQRVRFSIWKEFPRTATGMRKTRRTVLRNDVFSGKNQTV